MCVSTGKLVGNQSAYSLQTVHELVLKIRSVYHASALVVHCIFKIIMLANWFEFFYCLDMSGPMPSAYSPKYVEAVWYDWWEKQVCFIVITILSL